MKKLKQSLKMNNTAIVNYLELCSIQRKLKSNTKVYDVRYLEIDEYLL